MTCESKGHNAKLLTFKEISIDLNILLPFFRSSRLFKDSRDGARRLTRATVYAFIGIDVKHLNRFKLLLVLCRMDAIDRADVYTGSILYSNTRLSNNISHGLGILLLARCVRTQLPSG